MKKSLIKILSLNIEEIIRESELPTQKVEIFEYLNKKLETSKVINLGDDFFAIYDLRDNFIVCVSEGLLFLPHDLIPITDPIIEWLTSLSFKEDIPEVRMGVAAFSPNLFNTIKNVLMAIPILPKLITNILGDCDVYYVDLDEHEGDAYVFLDEKSLIEVFDKKVDISVSLALEIKTYLGLGYSHLLDVFLSKFLKNEIFVKFNKRVELKGTYQMISGHYAKNGKYLGKGVDFIKNL